MPAMAMPRRAPSIIAIPEVAVTPCPVRSPTVSIERPSGSSRASYQSPPISARVADGR